MVNTGHFLGRRVQHKGICDMMDVGDILSEPKCLWCHHQRELDRLLDEWHHSESGYVTFVHCGYIPSSEVGGDTAGRNDAGMGSFNLPLITEFAILA